MSLTDTYIDCYIMLHLHTRLVHNCTSFSTKFRAYAKVRLVEDPASPWVGTQSRAFWQCEQVEERSRECNRLSEYHGI